MGAFQRYPGATCEAIPESVIFAGKSAGRAYGREECHPPAKACLASGVLRRHEWGPTAYACRYQRLGGAVDAPLQPGVEAAEWWLR